jgi:AraC-like DNA-binding protein
MAASSLALAACRIERVLDGAVEIVEAAPGNRAFPDRLSPGLGICLKLGPDHDVRADGRPLRYPADTLCVRPPGCVWSTAATGPVAFVAVDIAPAALPPGTVTGRMGFAPAAALPALRAQVARLRAPAATALEHEGIVAALVETLHARGLIAAEELRADAPASTVRRARELLEARVAQPPSLAELARAVGVNRFLLLRQFRRLVGLTPHAFLLRLRVARAQVLLARGDAPIEVAYTLGFADQAHLTRVFKRIVGLPPGEYRHRARRVVAVPRSISFKSARARP